MAIEGLVLADSEEFPDAVKHGYCRRISNDFALGLRIPMDIQPWYTPKQRAFVSGWNQACERLKAVGLEQASQEIRDGKKK